MKNIYIGILILVAQVQFTFAQVYTTAQINDIGNWDGFTSFSIEANPFTAVDGDKNEEIQLNGINWENGDKPKAFSIFDPQQTNPPMQEKWLKPRSGKNLLLFNCNFFNDADNWIITPKVKLEKGTPKLEFYIQNYHSYWQRYQIWVSTTTNDLNAFKQISDGPYLEASGNRSTEDPIPFGWKRISFDLTAYANQEIYIGIHHITPNLGVMMAIDDFKIVYGQKNIQLPVVDFVANKTTIGVDETVTFTDQSMYTPTSWKWSFPGGKPATSTAKNPKVTYAYAGAYNVVLSTTNADGTSTKSKSKFITVNGTLKADFSVDKLEFYENDKITFRDFSQGNPTAWKWTFEGAEVQTSSQQHPVVSYKNTGTYDVTLEVFDGSNQHVVKKKTYVTVKATTAPKVDFIANTTVVEEGDVIKFTDMTSGGVETYTWILEGGSPPSSNQKNPEVTYYNEGVYKVSLKVSNNKGEDARTKEKYIRVIQKEMKYCKSSARVAGTRNITNVNIGIINNTTVSSAYTYYDALQTEVERGNSYPITVTTLGQGFEVTESGRGNKVAIWVDWNQDGDFSDENEKSLVIENDGNNVYNGNIVVPNHAKRRRCRMRIVAFYSFDPEDENPCNENVPEGETEDYNIYVNAPFGDAPIADFESNTQSVPRGAYVNFKDMSLNEVTGWEWHFEGGTPDNSYLTDPQIKYTKPGTYKVSLKVSNIRGSDSKTKESYILVTGDDIDGAPDPTCTDGIKNGDETGIDCGGSCTPCVNTDPYCTSSSTNATDEYINRVQLGTKDNRSTSEDDGYSDFTTISIRLPKESRHTIIITPTWLEKIYSEGYSVWIDYNQDGDFEDSGEQVWSKSASKETPVSGDVIIPASAKEGATRMRVAMQYNKIPSLCTIINYGEVEDYTVIILPEGNELDPTCTDGIKNGDETGIDCGGSFCTPCDISDGIVYVDIDDITVTASDTWKFFRIEVGDDQDYGAWYTNNSLALVTYDKNIVCEGAGDHITLIGVGKGIDATSNFIQNASSYTLSSSSYTAWNGKTGFIGMTFKIDGNTHYGWFHVTVANDGESYTLLDYAYNTHADEVIYTKSTVGNTVKAIENVTSVHPNPFKEAINIDMRRLGDGSITIKIYNMLGQNIYEKTYEKNPEILSFEEKTLNTGSYFIRINSRTKAEIHAVIKQ